MLDRHIPETELCTKVQAKKTIGSPNNKEAGPLELDVLSHLPDLKIVG
jgi:hypothetical protein